MKSVCKGGGRMTAAGYRRLYHACLVVASVAFTSAVCAQEKIAPENIRGVTRVDAKGVLALVEKSSRLVIVDSRIAMDRKQGHLEGSGSLPAPETNCAPP